MTIYNERASKTLLSNATDPEGDAITVRKIDGVVISSWPHTVTTPTGEVTVTEVGVVNFNDLGTTTGHPAAGVTAQEDTFTYTLVNLNGNESPEYTATINLTGLVVSAPSGGGNAGWDAAHDAGTTGDYFVDPAAVSNGTGTVGSPFNNLESALAAARTDNVSRDIKIRAGKLREAVSTNGFQGSISRYGTERALITAAEPLTGWVDCVSGDSAVVGSNWANMKKLTGFTIANAPGGVLRALNLYEDDVPMPIAQRRPTSIIPNARLQITYDRNFNENGAWVLSGSTITGITDANVIGDYTDAQLAEAFAVLHISGNTSRIVNITATNAAANNVTVDGSHTQDAARPWYNLCNIAPAMQQGEWAYVDNGDGTADLYCWPADPANVNTQIEYSARENCINISSQQDGAVTLEGLEIVQAATAEPNATLAKVKGICVGTMTNATHPGTEGSASTRPYPVIIDNCYIGKNMGAGGDATRGALYLDQIDGAIVRDTTIEYAIGSYGVMYYRSDGIQIERVLGRYTSNAPARFFTTTNLIHAFCFYSYCGYGGHTNQFNFYAGCSVCLNYGIQTEFCVGYATYQDSDRIHFLFCDIMASADPIETGGRALADQQGNDNSAIVDQTADSYVIHCRFKPHQDRLTQDNSLLLGDKTLPNMAWHMINNVVHGGGAGDAYSTTPANRVAGTEGRRAGNLYTEKAFWQKSSYGWSLAATEAEQLTIADVYTDAANGDFSPKAGTSDILTETGESWSAEKTILEGQFPTFNFDQDMTGVAVTASAPGFIGPLVTPANLT